MSSPPPSAAPASSTAGTRPAAPDASEAASPPGQVEVTGKRLLEDWRSAAERARAYLAAAGVDDAMQTAIAERAALLAATAPAADEPCDAIGTTLSKMRELLLDEVPRSATKLGSEEEFLAWRLAAAFAGDASKVSLESVAAALPVRRRLASMPPLARSSMSPNLFVRRGLRNSIVPAEAPEAIGPHAPRLPGVKRGVGPKRWRPWTWTARRRRTLLAILVWAPSIVAGGFMLDVLPQQGDSPLEIAIAICFGALFSWISIGFWTAMFGFFLLAFRRDKFAITRTTDAVTAKLGSGVLTAIAMPICEEPVDRVFAGLRAIYRSIERSEGGVAPFHFFVLSDTQDPGKAIEEEAAWFAWCRETNGFGRIFYRRRRVRIERKSGNVADFCRRWGRAYRYMIMLDADSVMSGESLHRLTALMEANPGVGMIQTAPTAVNGRSLFGRVQQFTSRLYGKVFAAGLHYWQLGEGQYWGHNTIIRVAPFMEHCALPRLPGDPPLGGEILSHDFVEAALMGRAGWALWLAYDLPGSWEETPSSLLEEMKRDRRWCQGNIQHLRLLTTEGLYGAHRALFLNGVLGYVSALLWFCFLLLSTAEGVWEAVREPVYFPEGRSLFPDWPVWRPDWAISLAAVTAVILFLPKILSILLVMVRGEAKLFGGAGKLLASALLETGMSTLFAPIRMVFHTRFVLTNVFGHTVSWSSQARGDAQTSWREAIAHHGVDTIVACVWAGAVFWLNPRYFWWLTPVVCALVLSVPLSVWSSRIKPGKRARARGLFLTPEEETPPPELCDVARDVAAAEHAAATLPQWRRDGFARAVVDPQLNAVHCALTGSGRSFAPALRAVHRGLVERALAEGPASLGAVERRRLLRDSDALLALHRAVWQLADRERAARWALSSP
ncbi:MAG: glucosyltransferase MdoH [Deltaproteobacteria bacterium]|nr:glucosyltransferase MdoH [Deltaproteobacteria bacterium]